MLTIEGVKSTGLMSATATANNKKKKKNLQAHASKPVCIVVDEIDGVTGGAGTGPGGSGGPGSEAGFIKALIDLIVADQRTASERLPSPSAAAAGVTAARRRNKQKESFRLLRPIIAVCNYLYAPALKPPRPYAEVVPMRVPPPNLLVERLEWIFQSEGYATEDDAARSSTPRPGPADAGS